LRTVNWLFSVPFSTHIQHSLASLVWSLVLVGLVAIPGDNVARRRGERQFFIESIAPNAQTRHASIEHPFDKHSHVNRRRFFGSATCCRLLQADRLSHLNFCVVCYLFVCLLLKLELVFFRFFRLLTKSFWFDWVLLLLFKLKFFFYLIRFSLFFIACPFFFFVVGLSGWIRLKKWTGIVSQESLVSLFFCCFNFYCLLANNEKANKISCILLKY